MTARWLAEIDVRLAEALATIDRARRGSIADVSLMDVQAANFVIEYGERVRTMVAVIVAAKERVRLRKAVRAHAIGRGPLPDHNDIFAADDALDAALAALDAETDAALDKLGAGK